MKPNRIILIRHGESEGNVDISFSDQMRTEGRAFYNLYHLSI